MASRGGKDWRSAVDLEQPSEGNAPGPSPPVLAPTRCAATVGTMRVSTSPIETDQYQPGKKIWPRRLPEPGTVYGKPQKAP